jgi:hypothetical protein
MIAEYNALVEREQFTQKNVTSSSFAPRVTAIKAAEILENEVEKYLTSNDYFEKSENII